MILGAGDDSGFDNLSYELSDENKALREQIKKYKAALEECRSAASNGESSTVIWIVNEALGDSK